MALNKRSPILLGVMRKPAFYICENKGAVQLRGNCLTVISAFCFCNIESTIPLLPKSQNFNPLAIFYGCTAQFVLDLVENQEDKFSHLGLFGLPCLAFSL